MQFYLVTLGCPKNEIISDNMAQLLLGAGHIVVENPSRADFLIVNTCGFIESAREESLSVLGDLADEKRHGQRLIAVGCFPQLIGEQLLADLPAVDGMLGTRRWMEIDDLISKVANGPQSERPVLLGEPPSGVASCVRGRILRGNPLATAYLSVADGCDASCAFCAIPRIKGPLRSRPVADILDEARYLVEHGAKELIIVAQDTTAYGHDRGEKDALPDLLRGILRAVPELSWLRLMYAYPQHITHRLIETMAGESRICHYLDLPLQHAHPETLRRMRRPHDVEKAREVLTDLREAMPDIALRTSLIVGYPGETEEEFSTLLNFLEETAFDKVGVFTYSREMGTAAYDLPGQIPDAEKEERYHRLMTSQQAISLTCNQAQVGRTLDVLVEGTGDGFSVGRSYRDAPEIDGLVIFEREAPIGEFVSVRVASAETYDLGGICVWRRRYGDRKA